MKVRLGINNCFAVKRWPEPAVWTKIARDELGLTVVQHSLDLVALDAPRSVRMAQAEAVASACLDATVRLHSTFTGLAAYSHNLSLDPNPALRKRAKRFFSRAIEFSIAADASATGGHIRAFSVEDWNDAGRKAYASSACHEALSRLAAAAARSGLERF